MRIRLEARHDDPSHAGVRKSEAPPYQPPRPCGHADPVECPRRTTPQRPGYRRDSEGALRAADMPVLARCSPRRHRRSRRSCARFCARSASSDPLNQLSARRSEGREPRRSRAVGDRIELPPLPCEPRNAIDRNRIRRTLQCILPDATPRREGSRPRTRPDRKDSRPRHGRGRSSSNNSAIKSDRDRSRPRTNDPAPQQNCMPGHCRNSAHPEHLPELSCECP